MDTERILQRQKAYESFQILLKEGKMDAMYLQHDGHLKLAKFYEDESETFYAEVNFWNYNDQANPKITETHYILLSGMNQDWCNDPYTHPTMDGILVIPHRLDGPAINSDDTEQYWIRGKHYSSKEEFELAKSKK